MVKVTSLLIKIGVGSVLESELGQKWRYECVPKETTCRSLQRRHTSCCSIHGIIVERVSCLVHSFHDLHGVWCVFQGWDVSTLGNTLSG